jgi:hypothetical protein
VDFLVAMTPRERMAAAMEGRPLDMVPIAPYFWGAEYAWKLMGISIWELILGSSSNGTEMQQAIMRRHDCDWFLPLHNGSGWLEGKEVLREEPDRVFFRDKASGAEFVFHMEGHWLHEVGGADAPISNQGANIEPPSSKSEADDWLKRHFPHLDEKHGEFIPDCATRDIFPDRFYCRCIHAPFAHLAYTLGFEPTLLMLNDNPSLCAYMVERMMSHVPRVCEQAAADGCDGGLMVDSFASADIMSPASYTNWVAPLHRAVSDDLHRAGLKSVMYNTGNMLPLLGTIGSLGYDAISIEERIKGVEMDIADVRRQVGPDVCLFANFDAYLLLDGDREKIRQEVKRQLRGGLVDGSRFIMGVGSPICDATDPDSIDFWIAETRSAGVAGS